jgi:hypothetical protein
MKPWLRRLSYLAAALLWLLIMSLPLVAFLLAARGQILIGDQSAGHVRLFLLNDADEQGLGVEWVRSASEPGCWRGRVTYFLWEGEGQNAAFCQCADPETGAFVPAAACP